MKYLLVQLSVFEDEQYHLPRAPGEFAEWVVQVENDKHFVMIQATESERVFCVYPANEALPLDGFVSRHIGLWAGRIVGEGTILEVREENGPNP